MSSEREPSLLQRVAAGDSDAVRLLVDAYSPLIWSLARRQLGSSAAEDVVQEVFISLWKDAQRFDPEVASEATFVTTIARRRVIDHRRRRGRGPRVEELVEEQPGEAPDLEAVDTGDEARVAEAAIAQLPAVQREVLHMAVVDGFTHREISDRLHMPLGTVKSHVRRGLDRVRRRLSGEEGEGGEP